MHKTDYITILRIGLSELLLITIVFSLFIAAFVLAGRFTKDTKSINALKDYLTGLLSALIRPISLDPEIERTALESLFNKVKVTCTASTITNNVELKEALEKIYESIMIEMQSKEIGKRSTWQQLKETVLGFNNQFFVKTIV